jgi:hypothetical protein
LENLILRDSKIGVVFQKENGISPKQDKEYFSFSFFFTTGF